MSELRPSRSFLDGLSTGYRLFRADWKAWVTAFLIGLAAVVVVGAVIDLTRFVWLPDDIDDHSTTALVLNTIVSVALQLVIAWLLGVALGQLRTGRVELRSGWRAVRRGPVWIVSIVIAVVSRLLDVLVIGLGAVAVLLTVYVVLRAVDGAGPFSALRGGLAMLATRFWPRLGFLVACLLLVGLGAVLFFVGLFVIAPVTALAVALSYVGDHDADSVVGPLPSAG